MDGVWYSTGVHPERAGGMGGGVPSQGKQVLDESDGLLAGEELV